MNLKLFCRFKNILKIQAIRLMASNKRYFNNPYEDYKTNEPVNIDKNYWSNYLEELAVFCVKKTKLNDDSCDGGLYVGNLGIVFMIHKVLSSGYCKSYETGLKKFAQDAIQINHGYLSNINDKTLLASFLLGNSGYYLMGSLVSKYFNNDEESCMKFARYFDESAKICEKKHFLPNGCDELFVGRAGVLCGVLFYRKKLGIEIMPEDQLFKILDATVQSGREYAQRHKLPCPLLYSYYKTQYIGAAHGLASILQMILSFPKYLQLNPDVETDVKTCIDFLLSIQDKSGNFPSASDEISSWRRPRDDELVHWCHGAPGVVWCIAKAYVLWKEEKYLKACKKCSDLVWNIGLLKKGPSICHGVAGNGYVHLLLYRLTNEEKYLYRALKFAEFLESNEFKTESRKPDNPYSLYEGFSGTVCYLVDLLNPHQAEFPFFDIFEY